MHTCTVVSGDRFWHESCGFTVGLSHVVNNIFIFLKLIGLLCEAAENQAQFVLTRCHFMMVSSTFIPKRFMVESISERIS